MLSENEVRNHLEIGKKLHLKGKWTGDSLPKDRTVIQELEERWMVAGYVHALKYVLGLIEPKWKSEK